ncbi:MAG: hypothetical protein GF398_03210 [Chitinivibrionales bacterium]|nr:hypothetical protein [Chitinivibrionales bacterium]
MSVLIMHLAIPGTKYHLQYWYFVCTGMYTATFIKEIGVNVKHELRKRLLYATISGATGLVYMGLLYLMDAVFNESPGISVTLAYASAMLVYFIASKLYIFKSMCRSSTRRELAQFALVVTVNYFITLLTVRSIYVFTGEVYSGSLVAGIVTISVSYVVFDKIIFAHERQREE